MADKEDFGLWKDADKHSMAVLPLHPAALACGVFPFYSRCREFQENNVPRDAVRKLKQALSDAQDEAQRKAAALALLRHSLRFGHRRLSLKRLEEAVGCGAALEDEDLHRCAELVLRVSDSHMHARLANLSRQLNAMGNAGL